MGDRLKKLVEDVCTDFQNGTVENGTRKVIERMVGKQKKKKKHS
jgi:hypothetical protein